MTPTYLSVVIPAYNEAKNFRSGVLDSPLKYLQSQKYTWELLFIDDGSTDDTNKLLTGFAKLDKRIKVQRIVHGGKASAVTAGMLSAVGEHILIADFDQSTPLPEVEKFLQAHDQGADIVTGIRTDSKQSFSTRIRSQAFVALVQIIALPGIKDTQCGFKSFTQASAKKIFANLLVSLPQGPVVGGYMGAWEVEVFYLSRKYGYSLAQVPVTWTRFPSDRLNIWKEPLLMARDTFRVRLYDILGKYASS